MLVFLFGIRTTKITPLACATFIAVLALLLKNSSSTDIASGLYLSIIKFKSLKISFSLSGNDIFASVLMAPLAINLKLFPI